MNVLKYFSMLIMGANVLSAETLVPDSSTILATHLVPLTETPAQAQSLRLITGHTSATLPEGSLELTIQHRFGALNSGAYNLYGLDNFNSMRIGIDYGVSSNITVGMGRSSLRKMYNAYLKWRCIGKPESPWNVTYLADMAYDARKQTDWGLDPFFNTHRFFYTHQLLVSYQATKDLVLSVAPTVVHANVVDKKEFANDIPAYSWYIRQRIIPKFAFTAEGSGIIPNFYKVQPKKNATIGVGFEYYTPLHVFQINISNARFLNEPLFMTEEASDLKLQNFCLGFNLIRRW